MKESDGPINTQSGLQREQNLTNNRVQFKTSKQPAARARTYVRLDRKRIFNIKRQLNGWSRLRRGKASQKVCNIVCYRKLMHTSLKAKMRIK